MLCTIATKRVRRALTEGLRTWFSMLELPLDRVLHRLIRFRISNRPVVHAGRNILASTWAFRNLLMRNLRGHACCSLLGWRQASGPHGCHDKRRQRCLSLAATTHRNTQMCQATHTQGKTGPGRFDLSKNPTRNSVQQDVRYIWEIPIDGLRGGYVAHLRRPQPGPTAGPLGPTDLFKPATSPRTDAVESTWTH